jgi:hypothetical protein
MREQHKISIFKIFRPYIHRSSERLKSERRLNAIKTVHGCEASSDLHLPDNRAYIDLIHLFNIMDFI